MKRKDKMSKTGHAFVTWLELSPDFVAFFFCRPLRRPSPATGSNVYEFAPRRHVRASHGAEVPVLPAHVSVMSVASASIPFQLRLVNSGVAFLVRELVEHSSRLIAGSRDRPVAGGFPDRHVPFSSRVLPQQAQRHAAVGADGRLLLRQQAEDVAAAKVSEGGDGVGVRELLGGEEVQAGEKLIEADLAGVLALNLHPNQVDVRLRQVAHANEARARLQELGPIRVVQNLRLLRTGRHGAPEERVVVEDPYERVLHGEAVRESEGGHGAAVVVGGSYVEVGKIGGKGGR